MLKRLFPFLNDQDYLRGITSIAVPIILQQAVTSALNAVDILMIGQLGEVSVAAVGLANQVNFLMFFVLFGVGSGAGVFAAQYWGKRDLPNIHRSLGIGLTMNLIGSSLFSILAIGFPETALRIYTNDPQVIQAGSGYLRLSGMTYLLSAVIFSYSMVHRSTGHVRLPTATGTASILVKSVFSFGLIFGNFGMPELGITGAAIATIIARSLELVALVGITYLRKLPAAASLREMFQFDRVFLKAFLLVSLPVVFNEMLWSLGISTYNAIYARIGTDSIAAYNIAATIEGMAFVLFIGLMDACAILIGNRIGAGETERARVFARRSIWLALAGGILVGLLILAASTFIPGLYRVSPSASLYVRNILIIMGCCLWIRTINMISIIGVLRSGGDTRFAFLMDAGTVWGIGVPLALVGAFVLQLSVYWVILLVYVEEFVKMIVALLRVRSGRWLRDLTQAT